MKFSVFTVCTPDYNIPETIKVLKEIGYDGVEWRLTTPPPAGKPENYTYENRYWSYNFSTLDVGKIEADAMGIMSICDAAGLEICSIATYLGLWDTDELEKVCRSAKIMNCRNIRVLAPRFDQKENYRNQFDKAVEQLKNVEKIAKMYDARIIFELHMGYIIPSASAAYRFISGCDPRYMGIIFDPGNMVHEGFENYKLGVELLGEYLAHIHIKNGAWKLSGISEEGAEIWKPTWVPYKKGFANFKELIQVLKHVNYSGYLSVEDFSNEKDTYRTLKENLQYLKQITVT